jgi:hypothetical protein
MPEPDTTSADPGPSPTTTTTSPFGDGKDGGHPSRKLSCSNHLRVTPMAAPILLPICYFLTSLTHLNRLAQSSMTKRLLGTSSPAALTTVTYTALPKTKKDRDTTSIAIAKVEMRCQNMDEPRSAETPQRPDTCLERKFHALDITMIPRPRPRRPSFSSLILQSTLT